MAITKNAQELFTKISELDKINWKKGYKECRFCLT